MPALAGRDALRRSFLPQARFQSAQNGQGRAPFMMTTPKKRKRRPSLTDTQLFRTACLMPGGKSHCPDRGQPFDIAKSEVVAWLIEPTRNPGLAFRETQGVPGDCFDAATRTWSGNPAALRNSPEAHVPPGGEEASLLPSASAAGVIAALNSATTI